MEVESLTEGTLKQIVVELGRTVPVGTVIAYLEKPGGETLVGAAPVAAAPPPPPVQASLEEVSAPMPEIAPAAAEGARREGPPASPRARRLARELGVDLSTVRGTGAGGRIVEEDIRKAAEGARVKPLAPDFRRRQLIAEKMTKSIQTIPHFSVSAEVNAERLISLHEGLKLPVEKASGLKLTFTDLLLKALGLALKETPEMNAVWEEGAISPRDTVDLGLAIATERGVVAPVVKNVDRLDLAEITRLRSELAEKARQARLSLADLEGGVGTLSNLGMARVDHFQAIIIPGQSFVLAVGRIAKRPWVENTTLTVRPTVMLTLSVDHRLADGAAAAQFLGKVAEIVENPYRILRRQDESGSQ
jgi:pyruvate dehydrogenase E2 component (dihydrolipoamide acetyltransferase)